MAQLVKNPLVMWETWVRSLGWEKPLEKGKATHSSILAWRIPLKSRDITLSTKAYLVKAMGFPVVIYGCESWTIKKAECQRIDAFELWCWRRLLRVPWTARRSNWVHPKGNQSWMFIGRTDAEAGTPRLWPPDVES